MEINFEKELNKEQYLAATSTAQYLRIIAGAGTGKTRTLTYRLANLLLRGDKSPLEIVAITFTNKAAKEMKERVGTLLEQYHFNLHGYFPIICTFHSFCLRFLRKEISSHYNTFTKDFTIADETDQKSLFKEIAESMNYVSTDANFKSLVNTIYHLKTKGVRPDQVSLDKDEDADTEVIKVYKEYQEKLAKINMLDFDDILIFTKEILEKDSLVRERYARYYKSFMIDEFQDTNDLQYDIVHLFMNDKTELCVVGDPDQTIYTWRGANNNLIKLRLAKDFPSLETVTLDLNYRSTQEILDTANRLISCNTDRTKKDLKSFNNRHGKAVELINADNQVGEAIQITRKIRELHIHDDVPYSSMAVIYRSNFLSRTFEQNFIKYNIPYKIYGSISFYQREEIQNALAYLKILINTSDHLALQRALKCPSRKVGPKTFQGFLDKADELSLPVVEYLVNCYSSLSIGPALKTSLAPFVAGYLQCQTTLAQTDGNEVETIVKALSDYLTKVGLFNHYEEVDNSEKALESNSDNCRVDNLKEFLEDIKEYLTNAINHPSEDTPPDLIGFLINVALMSDQDTLDDGDHVFVMTGHVSKGLEFPVVFVSGLVDGIFPTQHAIHDKKRGAMEEERRLFYVMMTRAKKYLFISTFGGRRFGETPNIASPLLKEAGFKTSRYDQDYTSSYSSSTSRRQFQQIDSLYEASGYQDDSFSSFPVKKASTSSPISSVRRVTRVDYSQSSSNDVKYEVGDKIAHASFGTGKVVKVDGRYLLVDFGAEYGTKKLVVGFKAFKKVSN